MSELLLLPAVSALGPPPLQDGVFLGAAEEALLLSALEHHRLARDGDVDALGADAIERNWMIVEPYHRDVADRLVLYGLMERHPNPRTRRWYRLTETGVLRAQHVAYDAETEEPRPHDVSRQRLLEWERRQAFRRLARDLAMQGFVFLPEPGRTPDKEQAAFFGMHNGEFRLYRCRLGQTKWYRAGYFRPASAQQQAEIAMHMAMMI
jgi:hypothetical protein